MRVLSWLSLFLVWSSVFLLTVSRHLGDSFLRHRFRVWGLGLSGLGVGCFVGRWRDVVRLWRGGCDNQNRIFGACYTVLISKN